MNESKKMWISSEFYIVYVISLSSRHYIVNAPKFRKHFSQSEMLNHEFQ